MTAVHADQLVDDYLTRLISGLDGVAPERREEIIGEIRSHIAEERARFGDESDADLRNLLDRLGDPAELAAAAQTTRPVQPVGPVPSGSGIGLLEILALVLTPLIWPVGVILLWASPAWRTRDKLIGTLVPPGGYPALLFGLPIVGVSSMGPAGSCMTETDARGSVISQTCTGLEALPGWEQTLLMAGEIGALVILLLLPVLTGIYLAIRLRQSGAKT
ncbi:MAG: HAAS signaling domain-containing protein [Candidatus Dormibacteraceae bacterium]